MLGNYPNSEADVKALDDIGITGILSCVTKDEISQRKIQHRKNIELYQQYGIMNIFDSPFDDEMELDELIE